MVLLGVILVLLAAAAGVVLVAGTAQLTDSVDIDVLGGTLAIPPLTLLITGMIVIGLAGFATDRLIVALNNRVLRWSPQHRG